MKLTKLLLISGLVFQTSVSFAQQDDEQTIKSIYDTELSNGASYQNLHDLCKDIGARISGSPALDEAIVWGKNVLGSLALDTVYLQEVNVPHWFRSKKEKGFYYSDKGRIDLDISALGGSVSTGINAATLSANIVEVQSIEELATLGENNIKGKIVFFNRPMDPKLIDTFSAYGGCVDQRYAGASEASKYGAVASITRSMTLAHDHFAHTGSMSYKDGIEKIPAVAISTASADKLSRDCKNDPSIKVSIKLGCRTLNDKISHNVIGEIKGSEHPEKIITIGGHLDSWDLGEGAHDDGAGCVQAIEVLRLFKKLNIKPKYTIRAVLFTNEENGNRGGHGYADAALKNNETHFVALESDRGGFTPRGFSFDAGADRIKAAQQWKSLLEPYGLHVFEKGYGGVDIGPLKKVNENICLIGFVPDSQRYFDYHHSAADVFESVNQRELELGAASMASLIYLIDKYWE